MNEQIKASNIAGRPTSALIEDLGRRVSVRDFTDKPIDDQMIAAILNAAFRAPTSSNI